MSLCAVVPAANMAAANAALEAQGYGPGNFSAACYASGSAVPSFAALHTWGGGAFAAAIKALANVTWDESAGDPATRTAALVQARGARWGDRAPTLPDSGNATAGNLYKRGDEFWWCIQTHSRSTYGGDPAQYPELIRRARIPGVVYNWYQPIDGFDAWKLLNAFTGQADRCIFNGQRWRVSQADGSGNNIWQPGVFGWVLDT